MRTAKLIIVKIKWPTTELQNPMVCNMSQRGVGDFRLRMSSEKAQTSRNFLVLSHVKQSRSAKTSTQAIYGSLSYCVANDLL